MWMHQVYFLYLPQISAVLCKCYASNVVPCKNLSFCLSIMLPLFWKGLLF